MKFLLLSALVSGSVFAATKNYDLKIDYSLNGNPVSGTHLQVKEGETATMITKKGNQESFVEVTPTEDISGVKMKFVLGTIDENGERTIISTPEIITNEKGQAQMMVGDKKSAENMSLSVIAKEQL